MNERKDMSANSGEAASPARIRTENRRRFMRRLRTWILIAVAVIVALMELVFGSGGFRSTLGTIGKTETGIANLSYAVSPDRKEIVVSYELEMREYDFFSRYRFGKSESYRVEPSRVTFQPAETRIPLDPMPDELVKSFVEVEFDPVRESSMVRTLYRWPGGFSSQGLPYWKAHSVGDPVLSRDMLRETGWRLPDGLHYRMTVSPEDEPLLSECFIAREDRIYAYVLMIPYGREGDQYVMLSAKDVSAGPGDRGFRPLFSRQIEQDHPEVLKPTWDWGFHSCCARLVSIPLVVFEDLIMFPRMLVVSLLSILFYLAVEASK